MLTDLCVSRLQREILSLEFARKDPDAEGRIGERQLADLLLTYADYTPRHNIQRHSFPSLSITLAIGSVIV